MARNLRKTCPLKVWVCSSEALAQLHRTMEPQEIESPRGALGASIIRFDHGQQTRPTATTRVRLLTGVLRIKFD